ncbi:unnamed protein product [Prunus armeniaca]
MLQYSLPGYSSCLLETNSDLDMMMAYLSISNAKSVDILVKDLCWSSEDNGDFCGNKELMACEKGESSCSSPIEDRNEFLGMSKRASAKPSLLNEWETYIHHVGHKFDGGVEEFRFKLCKYALEEEFRLYMPTMTKGGIRAKLELKPVEIIHELKDYYGIDISYYHAWFGK